MKKTWVSCALALAFVTSGFSTAAARAETDPYQSEWQTAWDIYQFESGLPIELRSSVTVDLPMTVNAPIDRVWSVYSNLANDIHRHPFLKAIYTHADTVQNGIETVNFTALEDVPAGPLVIPGHTHAQQRKHPAEHYYTSDSWDLPNITTHQLITFHDNGEGTTTVNERLTFLANPLLIDFTVNGGVSSHKAYQAALKHDIEAGVL